MERDAEFDQMLDDCHPTYFIGDLVFYASDILIGCDPIAYRVALNDYKSAQCEDGYHESELGETCDWCGTVIDLFDEGEE